MTLRDIFVCVSLIALGLAAELVYLWWSHNQTIERRDRAEAENAAAASIALSLHETSGAITRAAETAVLFQRPGAREMFRMQRDFRDGRVRSRRHVAHAAAGAVLYRAPFETRLMSSPLPDPDRARARSAWNAALDLARLEAHAIGLEDRIHALALINGPRHRALIDTLSHRITEFHNGVRTRTGSILRDTAERLDWLERAITFSFAALAISILLATSFVATRILAAFDQIRRALVSIANETGDQTVAGIMRQDEVGEMARAVVQVRDTSRARFEQLEHLAYHDPLTGLATRNRFFRQIEKFLAGLDPGQCCVVLMLDLDKFKEINDVYGHPAGDAVLCATARRLTRAAPEGSLIARFGGDEFAITFVTAETDTAGLDIADTLIRELRKPIAIPDGGFVTSAGTVGRVASNTGNIDADSLISRADMALYHAKETERGTVASFSETMAAALHRRRRLTEDMGKALERGELHVAYQPQVSLETGRVTGFEALLRWTHPADGPISPGEFIPIAEDSRAILPIGRWMIEQVCEDARDWTSPAGISVNVSPTQLYDADLPGFVADCLARHGLPPERFEIEVTENVLIDDHERATAVLERFKTQGIRTALDDFGTGYSSLSYLKDFPFDRIKIDQSFVRSMTDSREARAIVQSIIRLGDALDKDVIAEGVETPLERDMLTADGCREIQGYLTGKPQPMSAFSHLVGSRRADLIAAFDADAIADQPALRSERDAG